MTALFRACLAALSITPNWVPLPTPRSTLTDAEAVDPVLTTVQTDGATGYYSIMLARKDSGINTIEDMKGKKLGYADPDSTSGYLVPSVALPAQLGMPLERYFSAHRLWWWA